MTSPNPTIEEKLAELTGELLAVAAKYRDQPYPVAVEKMATALISGTTSRNDLTNAVAVLAVQLHNVLRPTHRLSESDRRLNVTGHILAVVSNFGGQRLVADNPAMARMVEQLSDAAEEMARDGLLPTPR